jgi:hypothetical protein
MVWCPFAPIPVNGHYANAPAGGPRVRPGHFVGLVVAVELVRFLSMSENMFTHVRAEGRLFNLDSGDWFMLLAGGFSVITLALLLI